MFVYLRGLLLLLFLPSILKVDRRSWDVEHWLLILSLWERKESPSLWARFTFSLVLVFVPVVCPQPCNMKFGANYGNYLRQDTTVLQRLKFLLSEMCSLESKNVVVVTFWVKLTMPALLFKKNYIFFCFFFLCFVLHTLTWGRVWHLYNLVQWSQLVICFYVFISYLLYKKILR